MVMKDSKSGFFYLRPTFYNAAKNPLKPRVTLFCFDMPPKTFCISKSISGNWQNELLS